MSSNQSILKTALISMFCLSFIMSLTIALKPLLAQDTVPTRLNIETYTCDELMRDLYQNIEQAGLAMIYTGIHASALNGQKTYSLTQASVAAFGEKIGEVCAPPENRDQRLIDIVKSNNINFPN